MALTPEWRHRVERWQKALAQNCYRPLGSIRLSGFTTKEQLTPENAYVQSFRPAPPQTPWGFRWEYGWFKGEFTLPPEAAGQRIVLRVEPGGEGLVWVNGLAAGACDQGHKEITLDRNGKPGEHYDVLVEAYAGHGPISVGGGPVPYAVQTQPEIDCQQKTVGESTFGIWLEEVYQLAVDFTTLFYLREKLDPNSLRVSEIDQALMDATLIFDPELPEEDMTRCARTARARLAPLLASTNGSTAPTLYVCGHAHLDVAWLWPLAETERKIARTASNQLALMEEYPGYKFMQSQPHLYTMLKQHYPDLYVRFKAAVRSGQVIADGGMWVEADTNISGGESLIRQILHGKRFFREEFGIDSKILWLPDVFGYSGALPQILHGCGMEGFATQKITWVYNGGDPFPYNTFYWEGIDGTQIPAHIFYDYNSHTRPDEMIDRWNSRLQKNGIQSLILSFGWGDGGGGPDRNHLEFLCREANLEGMPKVRMASPAEFFEDLKAQGYPKERYVGELYFQAHRGTYTSQAKTKQGNRRSEFALREAELWGLAARALNHYDFSARTLDEPWRAVLLNQFHDILPGSSIHRVYEEAEAAFDKMIKTAGSAAQAAAASLARPSEDFTVFNSLSWPRTILVNLPDGEVEVTVPACGWTTITNSEKKDPGKDRATATLQSLENEYLRVEFNSRGEITSLLDKETGREVMAGIGNRLCLYKDVPDNWDAWDIDSMAESQPVETSEPVQLEVASSGPWMAQLKLSRKLSQSTLVQWITLRHGSRRIEFCTQIDWQESHKLLKVAFPVDIHANEAMHEIQFGYLKRPNHGSRQFDADRFEVVNHKWSALAEENRGVAVLNDSKYGLSVKGSCINLTLLKSALAPDRSADKGSQTFTYALYPWHGSFADSNVVREAYELNCPVLVVPGTAGKQSLFSLDASNIILEAAKPAEDGSADIILRLYESKHMTSRCVLTTSLPVKSAYQTDMLENGETELPCKNGEVELEFRPFEIKTVRLKMS
ncbi:MAG: glycoside hydrolase family 38 C-terminal domain-containing protein [Omnitrophica WOR_2 bacterium]